MSQPRGFTALMSSLPRLKLYRRARKEQVPNPPSVVELDGPFSHELVHTRGVRLHVTRAGNPAGSLILLLHGSCGGWYDYQDVIQPLAQAGFDIAAVDMRGYGMSDKPPTHFGYDMHGAVGDVVGLIKALGHQRAVIVGTDSGGAVGWCVASAYPEQVRAFIGVGAAHPADLRRAIFTHPLTFRSDLLRALLCRIPPIAVRSRLLKSERFYRHQLRITTSESFQHSPRYAALLKLRVKASRIDNTHQPAVHNHRLLSSIVPAKWAQAKVKSPTLLLQPDSKNWRMLATRSRQRMASTLDIQHIPNTKLLPAAEAPEEFVAAIMAFLNGH